MTYRELIRIYLTETPERRVEIGRTIHAVQREYPAYNDDDIAHIAACRLGIRLYRSVMSDDEYNEIMRCQEIMEEANGHNSR